MFKAFLSHSSADKELVRAVAIALGRQFCAFDEHVFEPYPLAKANLPHGGPPDPVKTSRKVS